MVVPPLERDELRLNRLLVPLVPANVGTQFFGRALGPWIPAFAGMSGDWFNGDANLIHRAPEGEGGRRI
jgi:hypothetical protein